MAQASASAHVAGDGHFTQQCRNFLEEEIGTHHALLVTSCTHALEMAALLLDIQPGDEVILPSFTFVSTANAFVLRGAMPVFADIRPDTLNLDETKLTALITPKTRAIIVVHYAGIACEMDTILDIAAAHGIPVVEDNAHGLFGKYRGRFLGTFGVLATQSFHQTKNFHCGEGGALLVNEDSLIHRAEIIREKGTNRKAFFRGEIDKYTWVDIGSSYVLSDILAAHLLAQLEQKDDIQARRAKVWEAYHQGLTDWAYNHHVQLPTVPEGVEQSYHLYYMLLPTPEHRDRMLIHLREHDIQGTFHYLPLHLSDMGQSLGGEPGSCPVTEDIAARLVRLPFYNTLTEQDQDKVIQTVCAFKFDPDTSSARTAN